MILARGTLFQFLHLLRPGRVALNPGYDFSIVAREKGGYVLDYASVGGGCYSVGTVVELLLGMGEQRALDPGWELH